MEPKKQSKQKESGSSDENNSLTEDLKSPEEDEEEEEEEEKSKPASDNELESNTMRLRRTKTARNVYNIRLDKKTSRGHRAKKMGAKRGRGSSTRGRKKSKPYDGHDNSKRSDSESESEESLESCEYQNEVQPLTTTEKFLYKPGVPWPDLTPYLQQLIEIRVAREYITPKNKQVISRNL